MTFPGSVLAATPSASAIIWPVLWLAVAALAIIAVGFLAWKLFTREPADEPLEHSSFSLSELRRLRDQGAMSPAEYERARGALLAQSSASFAALPRKGPKAQGRPPGSPNNPDDSDKKNNGDNSDL